MTSEHFQVQAMQSKSGLSVYHLVILISIEIIFRHKVEIERLMKKQDEATQFLQK